MTTWIFVRHGESEANLLHEFSNRGVKHPLTDLGVRQAMQLAQKLKGRSIAAIYCSPLLRARQTAWIIGRELTIAPRVAPALIEFDTGVLEGKSDEKSWQVFDDIFLDWLVHGNFTRSFEGGDSFTSIRARFMPFVQGLQAQFAGSAQSLLFVGHGGTYLSMLPAILTNIDFDYALAHRLTNTGMVIANERNGEFFCRVWDGQVIIEE